MRLLHYSRGISPCEESTRLMDSAHCVIATKDVCHSEDLYVLVDFLNRTLKDRDIIFGLAKSTAHENMYTITIYRTDACAPKS